MGFKHGGQCPPFFLSGNTNGGMGCAFPLRAEKIFLAPLMGLGTLLNRLGAHCASITIFSVHKMGFGAHPKRHRLEACATNFLLSKRGACSRLFHRKQKTNYLRQDTIIKEITAVFGTLNGTGWKPALPMVFTVHQGGAIPPGFPFES